MGSFYIVFLWEYSGSESCKTAQLELLDIVSRYIDFDDARYPLHRLWWPDRRRHIRNRLHEKALVCIFRILPFYDGPSFRTVCSQCDIPDEMREIVYRHDDFSKPRSLKNMCRTQIRTTVFDACCNRGNRGKMAALMSLPIPNDIKNYLRYNDTAYVLR